MAQFLLFSVGFSTKIASLAMPKMNMRWHPVSPVAPMF